MPGILASGPSFSTMNLWRGASQLGQRQCSGSCAKGVPGAWLMVNTLIGGTLSAGGANAINMVVDRDIDRLMERTKNRPLVTGAVSPREALVFAVVIEVVAFAWLTVTVNLFSAVLAVAACLFYVFVYTLWLKRTSRQNIVIGGAAGAVPVLVGWAAVTNSLAWTPVILFAMVFAWTPPHFWALAIRYADDYRAASVPMLPAVETAGNTARSMLRYTVVLWALSELLAPVAHLGVLYLVVANILGAGFVWMVSTLLRDPSPKRSMATFSYSISYVTVLFLAMAGDVVLRNGW